jgi:serine protease Do
MKKMIRRIGMPVALVAGIGAAATAMQSSLEPPVTAVDAQALSVPPVVGAAAGAESLSQAFRDASRSALAGVVHVRVQATPRQVSQASPFEGTPFEFFFRDFEGGMPEPMPRSGSGSGFIITSDGYVLTNNHVVENATQVTVTLTDRSEYDATVVGRDPSTDVAVLKIEGRNFPTVKVGDSEVLEVGDWVLALGYPLSLGETVTAGIVSAKGRSINIMRQTEGSPSPIENFIQTDAAINPGNSGGPLVNLAGEAIGITTAIASPTGSYAGYGFAVPIKLAKRIADDLIEDGVVNRPRLGVEIGDAIPADVTALRMPSAAGTVVRSVPEGPAKDAGVRLGDVIVGIDGVPVRDTGHLLEMVAMHQPGDRIVLDILRYGDRVRIDVRLAASENAAPARVAVNSESERGSVGQLGFAATGMTPSIANQLGIRGTAEGVVITRVDPAGPAPSFLAGMRIQTINGEDVETVEDLAAIARRIGRGDVVSIIGLQPDGKQVMANYQVR